MNKKILLIEDNADVLENTKEILELDDYIVLCAENGRIGLEMAQLEKPDLIICDIMMPDIDGYGVLHQLSKDPATNPIPFIFLTAKSEKEDIRKGMMHGADDYITKPFDYSDLLDAVRVRLMRVEALNQPFSRTDEGLGAFFTEANGLIELDNLCADRRIRSFSKKDVVFREGDFANYLFFVVDGKVKCYKTDAYGKELVTDIYEKGEFVGYMALLEGDEYSETCVAMETSELSVIPKEDFTKLIRENRDVSARFVKLLTNNVLDKETRLLKIAYGTVRERAADALLRLYKVRVDEDGSEDVLIKISRDDLASIVGTATESLIRTLGDFKEEGIVEVQGRDIKIVNMDKIKRAAGGF